MGSYHDSEDNMTYRIINTSLFNIILLVILPVVMSTPFYTYAFDKPNEVPDTIGSWEKQLNEMNYLIMRTSAVNIINALALTSEQAKQLQKFEKEILLSDPPIPDMKGDASKDLINIRETYITLLRYLINKEPITENFKNQVSKMRLIESDIIKKSLLGAGNPNYIGKGCLHCHAPPDNFPKGDISGMKTEMITEKQRKIIDKAHVIGLYGEKGTYRLWELKSDVDNILNQYQKTVLKDFKCCLIPPKSLTDLTLAGQAFVTDEWINYFRKIRDVSKKDWADVKQFYIFPIEDLIEATLPGINSKDKKKIIKRVKKIINDSRKMNDITFEVQKTSLCLRLKEELAIDALRNDKKVINEDQAFRGAMFLLLPGNSAVYNKLIQQPSQGAY